MQMRAWFSARAKTFVNSGFPLPPVPRCLFRANRKIVHHGALIKITGVVTNGSSSAPVSLKECERGPSNLGDRQWNLAGSGT